MPPAPQERPRTEEEIAAGPRPGPPEQDGPRPTMLGSVAAAVGAPALQRRLSQRLQVQRKEALPAGPEGFDKLWDAHPHNYQQDESKNTASTDLLDEQGLPGWIANTCACRLSTMLNESGYLITPEKTKAAGLQRPPTYSKKTRHYYILAAAEMWTYLSKNFRKADQEFPQGGAFKNADDFQAAFDKDIKPIVSARKGIVAFETIFSYGGTGHVDLFSGEALSDSPSWYPSKRLHLWYIDVP